MLKVILFAATIVTYTDGTTKEVQEIYGYYNSIDSCMKALNEANMTWFRVLHEKKLAKLFCEGEA